MDSGSPNDLEQRWSDLHDDAIEAFEEENYAKAEQVLLSCLAIARELQLAAPTLSGITLNTLAGVYARTGRIEQAAETNVAAFEELDGRLAEDDYDLAGTARNAGSYLNAIGRTEDAAKYFRRALELARKSLGAEHPELSRIMISLAHALAPEPGEPRQRLQPAKGAAPLDESTEWAQLLRDAIAHVMAHDRQGDTLAEASKVAAELYLQMGHDGEAVALLRTVLEHQAELYARPVKDLQENPSWVLNYELARLIVFSENYQERAIEPAPMTEIRYCLAQSLLESSAYAEAAAEFGRIEDGMRRADSSEPEGEMESALADALEEDGAGGGDDTEGRFGGDEDEDGAPPPSFYGSGTPNSIDLADFYLCYGIALHFLGQQQQDRGSLLDAREKYEVARLHLGESERAEEIEADLADNLAELEQDLERL